VLEYGPIDGEFRFYGAEAALQAQYSLSQVAPSLVTDPYDISQIANDPQSFDSYNFEQQAQIVEAALDAQNSSSISPAVKAAAQNIAPFTVSFQVIP
jgi:hypothetical protein